MKGRRSEWRGDPLIRRSQRNRSPLMTDKRKNKLQKRPYRSSGSRSVSRERHQDHLLRHPDHGKELVQEHELPPQHRSHHQSSPQHRSLPPHDDGFRFQQHCVFPDHPSSDPSQRISQSIINRDFCSQINEALPSPSLDIEGRHILPLKSSFIEEGPSRQLYSNQPMSSSLLSSESLGTSGSGIGIRIKDNEIHSCKVRHKGPYDGSIGMRIEDKEMHFYNDLHRDRYSIMDREQVYAKDSSLPKMPPSQLRAFTNGSSSSILKEKFKGLHHDQIADGYGSSIGMRIEDNEIHSYNDLHRDQYGIMDRKQVYAKDSSFPKMPPSQLSVFMNGSSSSKLKEEFKGLHHDQIADGYDSSIGMRIEDNEIHSYNDLHRDEYGIMDRKQAYAKDSSFTKMPPSQLIAFTNGSSSSILKEEFKGLHHDQIVDGYDSSIGMRSEDNEMHSYNDLHRDEYGIMDRKQAYAKDSSFTKMPPSQLRAFTNGSSSSILKEEFKGLHPDQIADGFTTTIRRYPNDPLEHCYYRQVHQPDSLGHDLPDASQPQVYDYDKLHKRGLGDHQHRVQEEVYKMIACPLRKNATSSTILDYNGDWMEKADSPNRNLIKRTFLGHQDSLYQEFSNDYHHVGAQQELLINSDNYYDGLQIKSSDYETRPFEEGITHEKKYFPVSYRAESRNRPSDHGLDKHRLVVRTRNRLHIDDLNDYDIVRLQQRNYSIREDIDEDDSEDLFVNDRLSSAPCRSEEMWLTEEPLGLSHSKSMLSKHSFYKKISRSISISDAFMPTCGASSMHAKNIHNYNLKRRLKHVHSDFHSSSSSERRQDLLGSYKHLKRGMHDRLGAQSEGAHESGSNFEKNDPPEDSEEFKQKVHKAFLRYSKLLNESPHNRGMYQNQGNDCRLLCGVCRSNSKEFVDTNSLVIHTYHSLKVGLKTEHLGFHKALCILLGWNWRVPPDNSRAYQSMPIAETKSMQEDLILWPPIVIIHNSLIRGNIITKDAKAVTVKVLEKTLRDMGFAAGAHVCLGKPANQSIFTVKFMPTFSGLQEAQRLHNHFSDKKHGKQEFQQTTSSRKLSRDEEEGEGSQSEEMEEILFGYMAVAKDLDKLNPENKKRSLVKSMKDIQAIANAPLDTD